MNPMKEDRIGQFVIPEEFYSENRYEDLKVILEDVIVYETDPAVNGLLIIGCSPYFRKKKKGEFAPEYEMTFAGGTVNFKEIKNSAEGQQ
jgi:hypothetical protein